MHVPASTRDAVTHESLRAMKKAKLIAAQFEYSDDEVCRCIRKFLQQMGK